MNPLDFNDIIQYEQPNPFFIPMLESEAKPINKNFLLKQYSYFHVLCLADTFNANEENLSFINLFYMTDTTIDNLKQYCHLVSLIRIPEKTINNTSIIERLSIVDQNVLGYFNNHQYEFNEKELICLMLETKESNIYKWINVYSADKMINQLVVDKEMYNFYNLTGRSISTQTISYLNQIVDFQFWQNENNCQINNTNQFVERRFNLLYLNHIRNDEKIEEKLQSIIQNIRNNKLSRNRISDPGDSIFMNKKESKSKKTYYQLINDDNVILDKAFITDLLCNQIFNQKEKYHLFCNLLTSWKYCHYVLNNEKVLEANKHMINRYLPVFKYLFGYAWLTMHIEETIIQKRIKSTDRIVFDINTASKLPVFPYQQSAPYHNPYFTCLVADNELDIENNINGVVFPLSSHCGIVTLEELKKRINIFMIGVPGYDILNGYNWNKTAMCGSIMAATIPKYNNLMRNFNISRNDNTGSLLDFFEQYYSKSDIDIVCNHDTIYDYIEQVKHFRDTIQKNLKDSRLRTESPDVNLESQKTLSIIVSTDLLQEKCDRGEMMHDFQYIIDNKNESDVKLYFYELYLDYKRKENVNNRIRLGDKIKDKLYFKLLDYCEFESVKLIFDKDVYVSKQESDSNNCMTTIVIRDENDRIYIKCKESLKFRLTSPQLRVPIEFFRMTNCDLISAVNSFHLPCVRSYYDGTNCYMVPSAITAYQTLINIEYNYVLGAKDPIKIINKYRQRGYSILLNKSEIKQLMLYTASDPETMKMYNVTEDNLDNILGFLFSNSALFSDKKYNRYLPSDNVKIEKIGKDTNVIEQYKKKSGKYSKYCSELLTMRVISEKGTINPIKKWIIDAGYDLL